MQHPATDIVDAHHEETHELHSARIAEAGAVLAKPLRKCREQRFPRGFGHQREPCRQTARHSHDRRQKPDRDARQHHAEEPAEPCGQLLAQPRGGSLDESVGFRRLLECRLQLGGAPSGPCDEDGSVIQVLLGGDRAQRRIRSAQFTRRHDPIHRRELLQARGQSHVHQVELLRLGEQLARRDRTRAAAADDDVIRHDRPWCSAPVGYGTVRCG